MKDRPEHSESESPLLTREQALRVLLGAFLVGCGMPAEQPNPHGDTLDTLRTVLSQLQAAMVTFPKDPTLAPAVSAVAQAVALLASLPPTADEANGGPSGT